MEKLIVEIEGSGRHVHLTDETAEILFGKGYKLQPKRSLTLAKAFACQEKVTLRGPRGEIENVSSLGPNRRDVQVEVSFTDARTLGIKPPVRNSGDVKGSSPITIVGPAGTLELEEGAIVANRHIHMSTATAEKFGYKDGDTVKVRCGAGLRTIVMENVLIRVGSSLDSMHIDYDEQNAAGMFDVKPMLGEVIRD